jgi:hypothetical protein
MEITQFLFFLVIWGFDTVCSWVGESVRTICAPSWAVKGQVPVRRFSASRGPRRRFRCNRCTQAFLHALELFRLRRVRPLAEGLDDLQRLRPPPATFVDLGQQETATQVVLRLGGDLHPFQQRARAIEPGS